ncbi:THO complex subunit 6 isoform X4 [Tripterygium wilfordii]|uniref:THO complex subunit 6 isoform X4 n=1 Tax=Tripterygium wilfordii TaxID=458696 RepID=UPI0018F805F0|nr:THO complex subunit 6 isoform X4 [Tripterygium wilfordii]
MCGDATNWNEDEYRERILKEREVHTRNVFRTAWAPSVNPSSDTIVVASSDGSVASYSISSCISKLPVGVGNTSGQRYLVAEPNGFLQGHEGPAYDAKFYLNGKDTLLLSCGDDGRIRGWRWEEIIRSDVPISLQGNHIDSVLDMVNPQHKGPWGAVSPVPEINAIAVDTRGGSVFSAAGDSCAYCWDVETGKIKMVFRGHSDYLHCIVARNSTDQIVTGSEDRTARLWDCRSGKCIQVIDPEKDNKSKGLSSFVGCLTLDASESWLILAVGAEPLLHRFDINGKTLSEIQCAPQSAFSVSLNPSGVVAVGGYGGLVDVISQFGSHLCTFRCRRI